MFWKRKKEEKKQKQEKKSSELLSNVKDNLIGKEKDYVKREKISRKLPVSKGKSKILKYSIWTFVIVCLVFGAFTLFTRGYDKIRLTNNINAVSKIEQQIQGIPIYNARTDNFAKNYATVYLNYSVDKRDERKAELSKLSLESLPDNLADTSDVERTLNSIRLYSVEDKGKDIQVYKYIVNYTLKVKDNKKNKQEIINIPVKLIDNNYLVCDYPYFSDIPKDTAFGRYEEEKPKLEVEKDKRQELESFTKDFFKKYTTYKQDEMKYIMENPESISGKDLERIENLEVYKDNNSYLILATPIFKEKDFKLSTKEKFKLTVVVKDNKYYVSKFEHN